MKKNGNPNWVVTLPSLEGIRGIHRTYRRVAFSAATLWGLDKISIATGENRSEVIARLIHEEATRLARGREQLAHSFKKLAADPVASKQLFDKVRPPRRKP